MGKAEPMINVRMRSAVLRHIDAAAEREGLTRAAWCRELIILVLQAKVTLEALTVMLAEPARSRPKPLVSNGHRAELGATLTLSGDCLHPVHMIRTLPTCDMCAGCGATVSRRDDVRL